VAVDYYMNVGMTDASTRLRALADKAREALSNIPGITVQDIGVEKGGMVTFSHERLTAEKIKSALATKQINVSTSSIGSTRFDMERRQLPTLVRASFHYYNDEDELNSFIAAINNL